jgi:hypothetical protein
VYSTNNTEYRFQAQAFVTAASRSEVGGSLGWRSHLSRNNVAIPIIHEITSEEQASVVAHLSLRLIRPWRKWACTLRNSSVPAVPEVAMVQDVLTVLNPMHKQAYSSTDSLSRFSSVRE